MKNVLFTLVALVTLSTSASSVALAADAKALFQFYSGNMIGGTATRLQILDNGDIHLYEGRACRDCKPSFDAVIDRLDERAMQDVTAALALLKPGMKLRELTPREKRVLEGCAMDSSVNYSALGGQYEYGRLVVWQARGCGVSLGLANAKAERAMSQLRAILDKALADHRK